MMKAAMNAMAPSMMAETRPCVIACWIGCTAPMREKMSPTWRFSDATFNKTASSFDNPDFVDVVIHSYRHRNLNAQGEPRFAATERQLAKRPKIDVPSIVLYGADDGLGPPPLDTPAERAQFTALVARRVIQGAGHFLPRESPDAVSSALLDLLSGTR